MSIEYEVNKKKILLIDDNVIQLRTLKVILQKNYSVDMATNCEDALIILKRSKPDMIFLDYEMPECNGKETLEKIRQMEGAENIPVVFLTGVKDKENIAAVLKLNPAGYMLKPAEQDKIMEMAQKIIGS